MWHQLHENTSVPPYFSTCPSEKELGEMHQGQSLGVGVPLKGFLCSGPGLFLNVTDPEASFTSCRKALRECVSRTSIACLDKELTLASSASIQSVHSCVSICCLCFRHFFFFWLKMKTVAQRFRLSSFRRFFQGKESQGALFQDQIFH